MHTVQTALLQRASARSGRVGPTCKLLLPVLLSHHSCCKDTFRTKVHVSKLTAATPPRHLLCPTLQQDVPGHALHLLLNCHAPCLSTFPALLRSKTFQDMGFTVYGGENAPYVWVGFPGAWAEGGRCAGERASWAAPRPTRAHMPSACLQHAFNAPPSPASAPFPLQARRAGTCLLRSWRSATS